MRDVRDDGDETPEVPLTRQEKGDEGESLAARVLHDGMGHELLTQHTPGDKPQGPDLETLTPDGQVALTEVKSGDHPGRPHMTHNVDDRQMDDAWAMRALSDGGQTDVADPAQLGDGDDQVMRQVMQIDLGGDTATLWDVDRDGKVTGDGPTEIWNLRDFRD